MVKGFLYRLNHPKLAYDLICEYMTSQSGQTYNVKVYRAAQEFTAKDKRKKYQIVVHNCFRKNDSGRLGLNTLEYEEGKLKEYMEETLTIFFKEGREDKP